MSNKIITLDGLNTFLSNIKTYLTELLLSKQDKLISGANIKTINGQSILTDGNVFIGNITTENTELELNDPECFSATINEEENILVLNMPSDDITDTLVLPFGEVIDNLLVL